MPIDNPEKGKRKLTKDEINACLRLLRANSTEIMEWSQLYMVFHLIESEEGVDKEAMKYNKAALLANFNEILKKNIPPLEKRNKTFQELKNEDFKEAIRNDPLLRLFRKYDYIYHITRPNIEEKEHSIADLLFDHQGDNRFILICTLPELTDEVRNWGIVDSNPVTEATVEVNEDGTPKRKVPHGVYRIFCFSCGEFFLYEMNEGDQAEQIACDKCKSIIVEKRSRKKA